jgi:hypothetical protein
MEPFSSSFLAGLLTSLVPPFINGAGRTIRRALLGGGKQAAVKKCLQSALIALLATVDEISKAERDLLEDVFSDFFGNEEAARELAALLEAELPDRKHLAALSKEIVYEFDQLPGIDFHKAMNAFEASFIASAANEESLKDLLKVKHLVKQSGLQEKILKELQKIATLIDRTDENSLQVRPGQISGVSPKSGKSLEYKFIPQLLEQIGSISAKRITVEERGIFNEGDVTGSIQVSGDDNRVTRIDKIEGDYVETKIVPKTEEEKVRRGFEADRRFYLQRLRLRCQRIELETILDMPAPGRPLKLDHVYIDLDTETSVDKTSKEISHERSAREMEAFSLRESSETRLLSALEAAARHEHLMLLGDPGGGKSSFVKILCIRLADAALADAGSPAGISRDLLPILINLRDLAPSAAQLSLDGLSDQNRKDILLPVIKKQFTEALRRLDAEAFKEGLEKTLHEGKCLLILDGLDEVPYNQRLKIRQSVQTLLETYPVERVIVTCRKNSYRESDFPGYKSYTLAPFDEKKSMRLWKGGTIPSRRSGGWMRRRRKPGRRT